MNIILVENNEIVCEEEIISNIMNDYFTNIFIQFKLKPNKIDPKVNLKSIINTFQNHESVQRIKLTNFLFKSSLKFSVSKLDVKKKIFNFSSKKKLTADIPAKLLKNRLTLTYQN